MRIKTKKKQAPKITVERIRPRVKVTPKRALVIVLIAIRRPEKAAD